eukprot:TRINITY_DN78218_c0_g1_i1.p2 TRINITY_DN78218_c0_g1~~TRINITY_DN78218_c0_g1_i1.p2  ORF type:complete len:105 (-),score=20.03 TRINITY_DN78218_c0_g1_i1:56-370(-)
MWLWLAGGAAVISYVATASTAAPLQKQARDGSAAPAAARTSWSVACVVRLANSTIDDVDTFEAAAETWARHCRSLTVLVVPSKPLDGSSTPVPAGADDVFRARN